MKLYAENCTTIFEIDGGNITSIEVIKDGEAPYKIFLRPYGKTGNVVKSSPVRMV